MFKFIKKGIFCFLCINAFCGIYGQKNNVEPVYRRSSLHTLMVHDETRQYSEAILEAFENAELPEKFNNHTISGRIIPKAYDETLSKEERNTARQESIGAYLTTNDIAKIMVSKWFNRSSRGGFDMHLISERGAYNATEMDVKVAKNSERGLALLADAGEELIQNTFVVVNDFKYISKEKVAGAVKKKMGMASKFGVVGGASTKLAGKALDVVAKGYVIKTTSYLYKLIWDEETAAIFYKDYWTDDEHLDPEKKAAFDASKIFKLELIGTEVAWADLQSTKYTKKSEEELVQTATVKAVDAVIAKLQRKYEVFRTKTPLLSGDPITAKIGLKEGLEAGDKYEVLEQTLNKEGKTVYKRQGVIRVAKHKIWDNRYRAADEPEIEDNGKPYTEFKGGKKYYSGMLIRQIN